MCTAREKLREVEQEINCVYAELRAAKQELVTAKKETQAAEDNYSRVCSRNMCLTRNADVANSLAYIALIFAFIVLGLLVYVL